MRILFIVPYPSEGASNRYRVEQYLKFLSGERIAYDIRPFVSKEFYRILYTKKRNSKKIIYFLNSFFKRIIDIFNLYKYDVVFIHREMCPFGPPIFEWLIHILRKPIIFDFDDAIFLKNFNPANSLFQFLKFPSKVKKIIRMSSAVIVSNRFLEEFARKFNNSIYIIPTPIDTEKFNVTQKNSKELIIGWIGSPTTVPYLRIIFNVIQKLSQKYDFILKIVGAEEQTFIPGVKIENYEWKLEREIQDFQSINIGVYPLSDTLWAKGKAAFKAIQYMAVGTPVVASRVGMTKELIKDGINGFLAGSEEEWISKVSKLIEDVALRENMGLAGRKTVEEKYSVKVNAPKFLAILRKVYEQRNDR